MQSKKVKKIGCFLAGILLLAVLAWGRGIFSGDTIFCRVRLQPQQTQEYTFDIAQQGLVKYYLQPQVLSIHFSCRDIEKLPLTCRVQGFSSSYLSQGSKKKGDWVEVQPEQVLQRRGSSQSMQVNVEVGFPREDVWRYQVGTGEVIFYHQNNKYSSIKVHIINSKYKS